MIVEGPVDVRAILMKGILMLRIATIVAVFSLIGPAATDIASAQTKPPPKASNNCSLEGCITACNKQGGRTCTFYCSNEMARRGC